MLLVARAAPRVPLHVRHVPAEVALVLTKQRRRRPIVDCRRERVQRRNVPFEQWKEVIVPHPLRARARRALTAPNHTRDVAKRGQEVVQKARLHVGGGRVTVEILWLRLLGSTSASKRAAKKTRAIVAGRVARPRPRVTSRKAAPVDGATFCSGSKKLLTPAILSCWWSKCDDGNSVGANT